MAGSLLVAVRKALVDSLNQVDDLGEISVEFQYTPQQAFTERIWTRRATFNHTPASLRAGRNFRDEIGRFEVVVFVEGVGLSQEDTSERALEIAVFVEEFIADNKNNELGITGLQTLIVEGDGELNEMFNDSGHLAEFSLPIKYTARLT